MCRTLLPGSKYVLFVEQKNDQVNFGFQYTFTNILYFDKQNKYLIPARKLKQWYA